MKENKTHGIQLLLRAVVTDPDGKVISDTGEKPARSFVIQFLEAIYFILKGLTGNATSIDGTEKEIISNLQYEKQIRIAGGTNNIKQGIVVGTGDAAESNINYKLATIIAAGAGAGQLTYGVQVIGTAAVVGPNVDLELKRSITNNSGSTIIVKEVGLYAQNFTWSDRVFCMIRDVFPGPINFPFRYSLTVYYTLRTTV